MNISENNIEYKGKLTPMQEGMLFHYMLGEHKNTYYNQLKFEIHGKLDTDLFVQAYNILIKKHDALRTIFCFEDDKAMQIVLKEAEGRISVEDLSGKIPDEQEKIIEHYKKSSINKGVDLFSELSMQMKIFILSDERFVIIWGSHHIIMDGWSMGLAARDIFSIYDDLLNGKADVTADHSYSQYLNWISGLDGTKEMKYWTDSLSDCPDGPSFPEKEKCGEGFSYNRYTIKLDKNFKEEVEKNARSLRITSNALYQSVWGVLLTKYNDAYESVWGTVVSGRLADTDNIAEMVGLTINTMPVVLRYSAGDSFRDICSSINMSMIKAEMNSHVKLSDIQNNLNKRELVNHALAFENLDITRMLCGLTSGGMTISDAEIYDATSYDLVIKFEPTDVLMISFEYNSEKYSAEAIMSMAEDYVYLLKTILSDLSAPLNEISILSEEKSASQLKLVNGGYVPQNNKRTIELYKEAVEKYHDTTAIEYGNTNITYAESDILSNKLASLLRKNGVKKGDVVGVNAEYTQIMPIRILALLKTGAVYLPLEMKKLTEDRVLQMKEQCGMKFILGSESFRKKYDFLDDVAYISDDEYVSMEEDDYIADGEKSDILYIIYTSGSTGTPKGAMISDLCLTDFACDGSSYQCVPGDRVAQIASYSFDASVYEVYMSLIHGAAVVIVPEADKEDINRLADFFADKKITNMFLTTRLFNLLIDNVPDCFRNFRILTTGGEAASLKHFKKASEYVGGELYNVYGPTETAVMVSAFPASLVGDAETVHIGKPNPSRKFYVLDRDRHLLPIGMTGELFISGGVEYNGYISNDEMTSSRFIDDPFEIGGKIYATGDYVKLSPNGDVIFSGRKDSQVKVRGFRIELGEIEKAVLSNDNIKDAVVCLSDGESGEKFIQLFASSDRELRQDEMRSYLLSRIPEFMLPAQMFFMKELPMTINGKFDKETALRISDKVIQEITVPETDEQIFIAGLWSEVLGIKAIGIDSSFFELGGDSIKAMNLSAAFRRKGINIGLKEIFANPTIRLMSSLLAKNKQDKLQDSDIIGEVPAVPVQKWFSRNVSNDLSWFNQSVILELKHDVSGDKIKSAFEYIVKQHDVFRSVFDISCDGVLSHHIMGEDFVPFKYSEYVSDKELADEEINSFGDDLQSTLDISAGHLINAGKISGAGRIYLIIVMHHLITDGVTWRIVLRDLCKALKAAENDEPLEKSEKYSSYKLYSEELKKSAEDSKNVIDKWPVDITKNFDEIPLGLRKDEKYYRVSIPADIARETALQSDKIRNSDFSDIILSGFAIAFSEILGMDKVTVNLESHGRDAAGLKHAVSDTAGWFTAIYPFVLNSFGAKRIGRCIAPISEENHFFRRHSAEYGLMDLGNRASEPDICINYLGEFGSEISNDIFEVSLRPHGRLYSPAQNSLYQLDINSAFADDAFYIEMRFNEKAVSVSQAEQLLDRVKELIEEYHSELSDGCMDKDINKPFALSSLQMAYFMGRQDIYELGGFSTHNYFEFETKADIPRLERALNRLIIDQEMLRAVIDQDGTQHIIPNVEPYKIAVKDISGLSQDEKEKVLREIRSEMSHAVFDISRYPLFEFRCLKLDEERKYLYMSYDLMILDSVSASMFIQQLIMLYNDPDIQLPEHSYTYRDFIIDLDNVKSGALYKTSRSYWMSKADDFPPAPVFNYKISPSEVEKSHFARVSHYFTADSYNGLKEIAEKNGSTVSAVMLSAYGEVLSMFSGMSRVGINLTIFNRYPFHRDINEIYGDFTSTVLIDYDRQAGNTFAERCADIQKKLTDALENRYYDGVEFAREVAKRNGLPAGSTVMPVVFTSMLFEKDIYEEVEKFGELKWSIGQTPQVHLDFQAMNEKGGLRVQLDYVTELFETEFVENLFGRFVDMINMAVSGKEPEVSPLTENEKTALIAYNSTDRDYVPKDLASCFRSSAKRYAKNTAVSLGNSSYTYEELDMLSERVANCLRSKGLSEGEPVGIFVHRSIETIAEIIGIIKAGGCYVPMLPDYPAERVKSICDTAGISIMISSGMLDYPDDTAVQTQISPSSKAYIIFTSGSTGKPKGVVISHGAVINTLEDINERFNVDENDRIIGLSSMCFDLSVYDIFGSLLAGAELVMIPDLYDADNIRKILCEKKITIWNSVPSIMGICTEGKAGEKLRSDSLRLVMLSGDWIPLELPERIHRCFKNADVISLGGATEASIWSIYYPISQVNDDWKSIPYGYPLANQKIYVLDDRKMDCPFGIEGDIFIGGIGLSDGYMGEKELTERAFIIHPVYGRIYCTGDRGMFSPEGYVVFLGRKDDQVKIHGFRIELGEIEKAANELEYIENSAATTFDIGGSKMIALYAVANKTSSDVEQKEYLDRIGTETETASEMLPEQISPSDYDRLICFMDDNSFNSIKNALEEFGVDTSENNNIFVDDIMEKNGIKPVYRPLICQWMESLCEHGYAKRIAKGKYIGIRPFSYDPDFNKENSIMDNYSQFWSGAFNTYKSMHANYREVLTGKRNAVELLFNNGDTDQADTIYRKNPLAEYENNIVSKAINAYIRTLPAGEKVRILEFGAGTGGTTVPVLEGLETDNVEYTFTDISHFFLNNAKQLLKDYDFVDYKLFNIDEPLENVGFAQGSYDIILGANVLHDARDLPHTLFSMKKLLKKNGMFIVLEITKSSDMIKFSTGFLEGYSSYCDYRTEFDRTLLNAEEWKSVMESNGFHSASYYPKAGSPAELYRQNVIFAFSDNNDINEEEVFAHLRTKLPDYMIPDRFIQVNEIPLTANGKVNKKALPVPVIKNENTERKTISPETSLQKKIADIWKEIFNTDTVYIDDDFFEMGGDSLMAIRFVSELKANGIDVSIRDIYGCNTIRKLEAYITNGAESDKLRLIRQGTSDHANIVFIYGGSGYSSIYDEICRYIDPSFSCYGIDYGKDPTIWPEKLSIKDMAENCRRFIKNTIETGDIILAGWCVGGVIAAETASQLRKDGINVSKLIMLDSPSPDTGKNYFTIESEKEFIFNNMGSEYISYIGDAESISEIWGSACSYVISNREVEKNIISKFNSEALGVKISDSTNVSAVQVIAMVNLFRSFSEACAAYEGPEKIDDIKTLYIGAAPEFNDSSEKWASYADTDYIASSFGHFEMIAPENAEAVASVLNTFLLNEEMTELQKYIKGLWEKSFSDSAGKTVGLDTNFYDAGGDSISAIKLVAQLKNDGYEIDLTDIYMLDTVRKISEYLEGKNNE